jgi:hypothetical protein
LHEGFPADSCLIKLGDLFGDDAGQLDFEVARQPDLASLDGRISFDDLPAVAEAADYDLESLFSAGGCRQGDGLVPLIIVDDIDEIHSETSRLILRSLDRFVLQIEAAQDGFVHVIVLGRTEGFAPWYQDPKRNDDIAEYLTTYWLWGPRYDSTGDIAFLAENQRDFLRGQETWDGPAKKLELGEYKGAYVDYVMRHETLTYSIWPLAIATMIVDRSVTHPDDTESELKDFLFEELLRRASNTHGRPLSGDVRYVRLLEEIAAKYAEPASLVDEEGFFNVSVNDTVPVIENGRRVGEVYVRDVLDHSGIAVLEPASYSTARYRFDPVWMHAYLVESRNQRRVPFLYQARTCEE